MKNFVRRSVTGLVIGVACLVLVAAAAVVVVPARALFNNFFSGSDGDLDELGLGSTLSKPADAVEWERYSLSPGDSSAIPGREVDGGDRRAQLEIELNSVNPTSGTASLDVALDAQATILAGYTPDAWATKYQGQTGEITVGDNTIEIPLDRLSTEDFTQSVQLRMYANPSRYPNDWYRLAVGEVLITLPQDSYYWHNELPFIPVSVHMRAAPSMEGKSIEFTIEQPSMTNNFAELRSDDIDDVQIVVQRESTAKSFVWAMALAPALLILAAGWQLASSIRHSGNSVPQNVLPLELGIAVLAILPLRQVLVPSDIQGLTTVDFLLGTQLAVLIAFVAAQYARQIRQRATAASMRYDMGDGRLGGGIKSPDARRANED
jgi:hypothetical protein